MKLHWLMVKVLGLALLFSCLVLPQGTGSISGVVQDESGAVVPGANVTVTNVDTGINTSFMTDATGGYHVPSLIPGNYEVRAQISGFETGIRRGIQLTVGADLSINIPLKVGQVAQQTVVTAEAAVVDTLSSSVGALVEGTTIRDLPLNGRSYDQLISLDSAAATFRSRGRFSTFGEADDYSVNGAHVTSNLYLMDGTEMQGAGSAYQTPGGVLGKNLGVDAIQEFVVLSSNYSAGYGKKAGGIINIATRSGTNQLHGSAYGFLRNSDVDARNFFDGKIPHFERNEFGGSLGGPIKKDHSFFFGNYEGLRENLGISKLAVVPDALAHQGFLPDPAHPGQLLNIGVNPAVAPYLNTLFPLPNGPDFGDGSATYKSNPNQVNDLDFFLVRFDQKISDKDFFFARYNFDQSSQSSPSFLTQTAPQYFNAAHNRDQVATVELKRLFSPRTINLFRLGFSRAFEYSLGGAYNPSDPALTALNFLGPGFSDGVGTIRFSANGNVVAQQGLAQVSSGTCTGSCPVGPSAVTQYEAVDQLFRYVGKHSLQFGVQVQKFQENEGVASHNAQGTYTFSGGLTSFLEGLPTNYSGGLPGFPSDTHKAYRRTYFSTYVQDDYKVLPNLTLNLGLRYELFTVPTEASGNRISNYQYTFVNGVRILNATPTLGAPIEQGNHLNIAPRFGFAWDPFGNGKTSVRGGFGMFYDQDLEAFLFLSSNPPYSASVLVTNPSFPNPFAGGTASAPLPSPQTIDPAWKTPTRLQYSLGIQRQITSSSVLNIGYVGSHAYHTESIFNANTALPTLVNGVDFFAANLPRIQPAVSGGGKFTSTYVNTSYNSLQTDFTQRLSHGMRYKISYTYSKNIDQGPGIYGAYANGENGMAQNPFDLAAERGTSPYNLTNSLAANYTYIIPWGKTSGFSGKLMSGWQVGGIITAHPGTPFTISTGFSRSRDLDSSAPDRPELLAGTNGVPILGGPNTYFNSSVFVLPAIGTFGNVSRNTVDGPGFADVDFSLTKTTTITERVRVEFRAEFFNILNHANFDLPASTIFNATGQYLGTAGHVSQTVTTSRQIQGGLKFIF